MAKLVNLVGKTAVVTGSSEGIGFAIAKRLGQRGANVVISSRKESNIDRAVNDLKSEGIPVLGVKCHVNLPKHRTRLLEKTLEHFGQVNILVSNVAINTDFGPVLECSEQNWDRIFETNVKAMWQLTKEFYPHLKKQKGSNIVLVSSVAGYTPLSDAIGAYSVSKTTLFGLTKVLSQDLASEGIRVNCVAPGIVKTKFSKVLYESPESMEKAMKMIPMKKLADPEDISGTVVFLVSDDAKYITGETICVTGGMQSRL
ncbi:dehydrogenase/reductase SDR family member 4-like [Culicoides brevitarsis]|uniref:dehydrogenase/reductase SDR family member 4-like n=1 Tax=Culicoides brevitarsis TaxID=469753 RepID=UPI00307CA1F6